MSKLAICGGESVAKNFIPFSRHLIEAEEILEVVATLKSDWITKGPKTFKFEEMFSGYTNSKFSIAVNSCTSALNLALAGLGISKGDEVITSPLTFAATTEVILHQNAQPVFVDVESDTYNLDPSKIEEQITKNTKAIIPVHYAGHPCDMDEIMRIASNHELYVIEDAAHAVGSKYKGNNIGTIGDVSCFSFYATKNLTTGEGGMITTNNAELAEKMRMLSLHGISQDAWKRYSSEGSWYYEILYPGYKCNMSDVEASIGIHQLKKLDSMMERRKEIADIYNESFEDVHQIITPTVKDYAEHAWHLYPVLIDTNLLKITRNEFINALKAENIGTSVHFIPLHLHPYYKNSYGYKKGDFPVTESIYEREISIPIYPRMTDEDVQNVISAIKKIINYYKV